MVFGADQAACPAPQAGAREARWRRGVIVGLAVVMGAAVGLFASPYAQLATIKQALPTEVIDAGASASVLQSKEAQAMVSEIFIASGSDPALAGIESKMALWTQSQLVRYDGDARLQKKIDEKFGDRTGYKVSLFEAVQSKFGGGRPSQSPVSEAVQNYVQSQWQADELEKLTRQADADAQPVSMPPASGPLAPIETPESLVEMAAPSENALPETDSDKDETGEEKIAKKVPSSSTWQLLTPLQISAVPTPEPEWLSRQDKMGKRGTVSAREVFDVQSVEQASPSVTELSATEKVRSGAEEFEVQRGFRFSKWQPAELEGDAAPEALVPPDEAGRALWGCTVLAGLGPIAARCAAARPLYTRFASIFGTSLSEPL